MQNNIKGEYYVPQYLPKLIDADEVETSYGEMLEPYNDYWMFTL